MNQFEKDEIRDSLMFVKQGEISITESLNDIIEIVKESNARIKRTRERRIKNKNILRRNK